MSLVNSVFTHLRAIRRRDLPAMLAIERASFAAPWRESDFDAALASDRAFALAAEYGGELCGYLIGEQEGRRVQVFNLCVDQRHRRQGVASQLVGAVAEGLNRRQRLMTIVNEHNLTAQLFFRSQSFWAVTILRKFRSPTDDAYLFEYRPGDEPAPFMPANRVAAYL